MAAEMKRENMIVRLARALSGMTQREFAEHCGIHPISLAQFELGKFVSPQNLRRILAGADLTLEEAEEHLRLWEARRGRRLRQSHGAEDLLAEIGDASRSGAARAYQRLLRLPVPSSTPRPEDRIVAREQLSALKAIAMEHRVSAVKVGRDLQNWALAEASTEESVEFASRDLKEARVWAEVAVEIADRVRGPEDWCSRVRGYAGGAMPNLLRVMGKHDESWIGLDAAKRLWVAGSDPNRLLDPGRLLDFEASLLRDQRRFPEALAKLAKALSVSHHPARILVIKGFTLEVMGEYEQGISALLEAEPRLDRKREPRLWYKQRSSLAVLFTHVGRHREATNLIAEARPIAIDLGDVIDLARLKWLDGRVAAGLGRRSEALRLLAQAREDFEGWDMGYDVALALVEEAALLLDEGRTAEVKALALGLVKVFQSKQIHPETLVALQLFQKAVERDEATSEQARNVLRFLFRARHDPGLRFDS